MPSRASKILKVSETLRQAQCRLFRVCRDELRYILDPQDVHGADFLGETFRVLKEEEMRLYGEFRTRRLVLEAWDRLEGVEIGNPQGYREEAAPLEPKQETIHIPQPKQESQPAVVQDRPSTSVKKEPEPHVVQPTLTDFGLYKCLTCGKMVMGFEKEKHTVEVHKESVKWKVLRGCNYANELK